MLNILDVLGSDFFKPLACKNKYVYYDCIRIVLDSYRTEMSYGIDREMLVEIMTNYFNDLAGSDAQKTAENDDDAPLIGDARAKASEVLRRFKAFKWIVYETGPDLRTKVVMPADVVTVFECFGGIERRQETEYQSEISTIYSLLMNDELLSDPYAQVLLPVHNHTLALFTGLKKMLTDIKRYVDQLTADKTAMQIIENFCMYQDEIGSKAFKRLHTNENISRFRNKILLKLDNLRSDEVLFERLADGYKRIENAADTDEAKEMVRQMINNVIDQFASYDDRMRDIENQNRKYFDNAVRRAKFSLMNGNNAQGKLSIILKAMSAEGEKTEEKVISPDAAEKICSMINIFEQGFIDGASIRAVPISKRITEVENITVLPKAARKEIDQQKALMRARFDNAITKKKINEYVSKMVLGDADKQMASSVKLDTRRDLLMLASTKMYGYDHDVDYEIEPTDTWVEKNGFRYKDFEIRRKAK